MSGSAQAMRRAFDASFAQPLQVEADPQEDLVVLRVGGRPMAVRALETLGLWRCPAITALPSNNPALLGLVGVRGALVAVYSMAVIAGMPPLETVHAGFIVTSATDTTVALFFDELVGYETVRSDEIVRESGQHDAGQTEVVRIDGELATVVGIAALLENFRRPSAKERRL